MPSIFVRSLFYLMPFTSIIAGYIASYCSNFFEAIVSGLILIVITFILYVKLVNFCKVTYENMPLYLSCYSIKMNIPFCVLFNLFGMMGYDFYCIKRYHRQYMVISKRRLVDYPHAEIAIIKLNSYLLLEVE
jgi:hypothetical protein